MAPGSWGNGDGFVRLVEEAVTVLSPSFYALDRGSCGRQGFKSWRDLGEGHFQEAKIYENLQNASYKKTGYKKINCLAGVLV